MVNKRRQRSLDAVKQHRMKVLDVLFQLKLQDLKFEKLLKTGFIKEIKDGESQSVHL